MKPNQQSELDAFMDFCLEHWNDPFNSLESNPELIAKLEEGIQNLLLPACEEGDENAMFWMAECYDFGWGIEPDGQKAFTLRRKLAEMGHTDQQINMGNYYREGDLVKRNPRAAFCWYVRAAKQGDWYGRLLVADCYFEGDGVKRDYKEAVKWYESGVAQFDNEHSDRVDEEMGEDLSILTAVNRLAQCYRDGLGVKKDLEKVAEWYDKAGWHSRAELIRKYGDDADEHDPDCPF